MWRSGAGGGGGASLAALAAAALRWRRRSDGGSGGGGVNEASALAATATTTAVMEAAEKGVAVKSAGWKAACRTRATREKRQCLQRHLVVVVAPLTPLWAHPRK